MEQEINTKMQLATLIANPGNVQPENAALLRVLAEKYPYYQPLHLLLAKAVFPGEGNPPELATAALYGNGQLLHNILYAAHHLTAKQFSLVSYLNDVPPVAGEPDSLDESCIDEVAAGPEYYSTADQQEVFDEIGEVNINEFRNEYYIPPVSVPPEELHLSHEVLDPQFETLQSTEEPVAAEQRKEDDLVLENIVATDFFAFQDNFAIEDVLEEPNEQVISKYDDDRLPYTFLWWLAKTRKEHEQIFQPYASPKKNPAVQHTGAPGLNQRSELQQQYVENIFHMQSVFSDEEKAYSPAAFRKNSKGDEIIESFIKNEPQISPPKAELINNENKAKKSAEDHSELVSETLAKIYIEQMLYDKAIETYEKLSLMFPEKSRYFADLVQSIEKKI